MWKYSIWRLKKHRLFGGFFYTIITSNIGSVWILYRLVLNISSLSGKHFKGDPLMSWFLYLLSEYILYVIHHKKHEKFSIRKKLEVLKDQNTMTSSTECQDLSVIVFCKTKAKYTTSYFTLRKLNCRCMVFFSETILYLETNKKNTIDKEHWISSFECKKQFWFITNKNKWIICDKTCSRLKENNGKYSLFSYFYMLTTYIMSIYKTPMLCIEKVKKNW